MGNLLYIEWGSNLIAFVASLLNHALLAQLINSDETGKHQLWMNETFHFMHLCTQEHMHICTCTIHVRSMASLWTIQEWKIFLILELSIQPNLRIDTIWGVALTQIHATAGFTQTCKQKAIKYYYTYKYIQVHTSTYTHLHSWPGHHRQYQPLWSSLPALHLITSLQDWTLPIWMQKDNH